MSTVDLPPERPRRADAVRNRAAVVRAAAEVFTERGAGAGVEEIAARAGVGKATVYRSFPTKEHLIAAVATERLQWLADQSEAALADPHADGFAAVRDLLRATVRTRSQGLLAHGLAHPCELPELQAARDRAMAAGAALLHRGQEQGTIREDVTHPELILQFRGITLALHEAGEQDTGVWLRHVDLLADALRPR